MPSSLPSEVPATLLGLVQRPSVSGSERLAAEWLAEHATHLGANHAGLDEAGSLIAVWGSGPRQIVLLGHIDTVPGEINVRIEDGQLYGRGSVDAKGPLAAFVDAAAAVGDVPGWQVVVIGAVGEETDSIGARSVVDRYQPDYAVIGEPSRWDRVTLGYKGCAAAAVRTHKTTGHSARAEETACDAAVAVWTALRERVNQFNADRKGAFHQIQANLGSFTSHSDGFAETAEIHIRARLPLDVTPADWYQWIEACAGEAAVERLGFAIPAYRADKNSPLVRAFLGAVRAEGGQPGFVVKTGTADLNIVAPAWGCPALAYGPGDSALDHTPDEHIDLHEYALGVNVLTGVLRSLMK